jgi:hypothetical protein
MARQPRAAPTKRWAPGHRPVPHGTSAQTTAEITAALRCPSPFWRLFPALTLALPAAPKGGYGRVLPDRRAQVTLMRHLFRQPCPVTVLTYFVVYSAGFGLLIPCPGGALFFRPRQLGTRRAIPIAAIATPADHYFPVTSLAVENPAVLFWHPVSAHERALQGQPKERCSAREHRRTCYAVRSLRGSGRHPGPPPPRRCSRRYLTKPVHLSTSLSRRRWADHRLAGIVCLICFYRTVVRKGVAEELLRGGIHDRRRGGHIKPAFPSWIAWYAMTSSVQADRQSSHRRPIPAAK